MTVYVTAWHSIPRAVREHRLGWPARCDGLDLGRLQRRSASGEMAADFAALDAIQAREKAARLRAQVAAIAAERARLGLDAPGGGSDVLTRASRYLATIDGGSGGCWRAALVLVRGWALDESAALDLLLTEYVPRYHRRIARGEVVAMVRRASRATQTGYGWLLEGRKAS